NSSSRANLKIKSVVKDNQMGLFYYTFLYKREIIRVADDFKEGENDKSKYAKADGPILNGYVLYCDNSVVLNEAKKIVTDDEIANGYISLPKLIEFLDDEPALKEEWGTPEDNDDIYICECTWNSKLFL